MNGLPTTAAPTVNRPSGRRVAAPSPVRTVAALRAALRYTGRHRRPATA
jgi:hypothetical protein